MLRWCCRILIGLVVVGLTTVVAGPWLLYAIGLAKIDGRPDHASEANAAPEDVEALRRDLRMSQPIIIDRLSPHSYIWQSDKRATGWRVVWLIAREHNDEHLADRSFWHLSGAALMIWLTRNWTVDELIAKAVELEKAKVATKKAINR